MTKKRISSKEIRHISIDRINTLMQMARNESRYGNYIRSKRYVELARKISNKTKTSIPKGDLYCKTCLSPLIPGMNCRVRLNSGHLCIHCLNCGKIIRTSYAYKKSD
ncbi:ribonuclease P protein component 4 [Candidatus Methanomassiliicoccus intestinalis]|uniref:Ribonuclease P protein component 4 n=2 Tax=Candidatus Methanomassiliicoccus intestinalis TaxID=1406512 RepID=R9T7M9_METII|nr:Ribonuclease P protein component 4 [Candidatus Methanomassiliicoccus intestinalis Issoire-Mx1]TQS83447.1 MAG: hypothetical protein A3207_07565 [Candidatus Methanomassiliicoccus intestinalis]TQS83548.1 MAG: hypothetical protein A3206_05690 [Candidatus Methanomassiliicoccus intestinalis]